MTYEAELAEFRQQAGYGRSANTLVFWPKIDGVGNVAVSGTPTYAVYRPSDDPSVAALVSGNATKTSVGGVDMISISLDCSATSTYVIDQYYRWNISYVYSSSTYVENVYFDVARDPYHSRVSLNELIEEVSDMEVRCSAQASRIASGRTAGQHASVIGVKAWNDVQTWVRTKAEANGQILPSAILDHEAIDRVVIAQAVARVYRAEGGGGTSESWQLAEYWGDEARRRFDSLPPLRYDADQNSTGDTTLQGFGVIQTRRTW